MLEVAGECAQTRAKPEGPPEGVREVFNSLRKSLQRKCPGTVSPVSRRRLARDRQIIEARSPDLANLVSRSRRRSGSRLPISRLHLVHRRPSSASGATTSLVNTTRESTNQGPSIEVGSVQSIATKPTPSIWSRALRMLMDGEFWSRWYASWHCVRTKSLAQGRKCEAGRNEEVIRLVFRRERSEVSRIEWRSYAPTPIRESSRAAGCSTYCESLLSRTMSGF